MEIKKKWRIIRKIKKENSKESQEVLMPFNVYKNKMQQNIDLLIRPVKFRNKYMLIIDKNIVATNNLLFEVNKEVLFIQNGWEFLSIYLSDQWNLIQNVLRINYLNLE